MERRQVDLGLVDILEAVRREERPKGPIRSSTKPKKEQRRAKRPGRRERMEKRGGRARGRGR
jgi:hypothetical protein